MQHVRILKNEVYWNNAKHGFSAIKKFANVFHKIGPTEHKSDAKNANCANKQNRNVIIKRNKGIVVDIVEILSLHVHGKLENLESLKLFVHIIIVDVFVKQGLLNWNFIRDVQKDNIV